MALVTAPLYESWTFDGKGTEYRLFHAIVDVYEAKHGKISSIAA